MGPTARQLLDASEIRASAAAMSATMAGGGVRLCWRARYSRFGGSSTFSPVGPPEIELLREVHITVFVCIQALLDGVGSVRAKSHCPLGRHRRQ